MWRALTLVMLAAATAPSAWDALSSGRLASATLVPVTMVAAIGVWRLRKWTVPCLATLAYVVAAAWLASVAAAPAHAWLSTAPLIALQLAPGAVLCLLWLSATYAAHRAVRAAESA